MRRHLFMCHIHSNILEVLRAILGNFSNIDFFLRFLPLKVDELVMSEM